MLTKSLLEDMYVTQGLSVKKIAKRLGTNYSKIYRKLLEFGFLRKTAKRLVIDKILLEDLYIKQRKSMCEIGELLGVSHRTISNRIKEFGLPLLQNRRTPYKQHNISKNVLEDLYLNQQLFIKEIASHLKVSSRTVSDRLKEYNIPLRSKSEHQALLFTRGKYRKIGKHKDPAGYVLVKCSHHLRSTKLGFVREHILVWEKSHAKPLPEGWVIHHLNGVKDDNRPENLVGIPVGKHHYGLNLEAKRRRIRELEKAVELKFGCKIEKSQQNKKSTADPRQLLLVLGTAG